jgi:hypothetical protein
LFVTIWYIGNKVILRLLEMQNDERKEWIEAFRQFVEKSDSRQAETNTVIRGLTVEFQRLNERGRRYDNNNGRQGDG